MHIENILFLDIETVSQTKSHALLDEEGKLYWRRKAKMMIPLDRRESDDAYVEAYHDKAGIFAEFGKIICISVGIIHKTDGVNHLRIKSFAGDDESLVLEGFFDLVRAKFNDSNKSGFCGHNIREFDIPYICRRAIINGLLLPATLDLRNRKPWEIKHLYDTLEMWKFGDIKHYISLALLAHILDIPSPKDDIDGSMVGDVYWQEQDLQRIVTYCQKDVATVANVYLRLNFEDLVSVEHTQTIQ